VDVQLSSAARRRYPDAQVNFRRVYLAPGGPDDSGMPAGEAVEVSRVPVNPPSATDNAGAPRESEHPSAEDNGDLKRRKGVSESSGPRAPALPSVGANADRTASAPSTQGGWRRVPQQPSGGWRRATPADKP
jgi:hypothetical protein